MKDNGFLDMADHLGTLTKVTDKVATDSLEEAANFYVSKLIPRVPKSLLKKSICVTKLRWNIQKKE